MTTLDIWLDSADYGCTFFGHGWRLSQLGPSRDEQMIVPIVEVRWVEVRKPAKDRLAKAEREGLCVACMEPLGDQTPIRGCHPRCHRATLRAIVAGKTTEAERMTQGKLLIADKGGRKPSNPVSKEVSK